MAILKRFSGSGVAEQRPDAIVGYILCLKALLTKISHHPSDIWPLLALSKAHPISGGGLALLFQLFEHHLPFQA